MSAYFPCVGFDARLWHHTGIGRYIRNLLPRLHGVDLVVWVLPEDACTVRSELPHAAVRLCPAKPFSLQELSFWRRELREVPVDLFHAPHINVPMFSQVPLVVTLHDLIPLRFRGTLNSWLGEKYFSIMSQLAVTRAERVISVSENTRRDLIALLEADPAKIRIIPEGADPRFGVPAEPDRLLALRERYGLHGPYLIYAGQWKPHKNLDTLLKAFANLRQRHPDLQLVLVGREDPRQPYVPNLIGNLGLGKAVIRTGYVRDENELVGLFQGAAVLAHPSRYEGFGLPPLEAMAAGVPVVASDAASLPEVVGQAGMLVPPDSVSLWTEALERALVDPSLREGLINAGYERVRILNWERAAQLTCATYDDVLGARLLSRTALQPPTAARWDRLRSARPSLGT